MIMNERDVTLKQSARKSDNIFFHRSPYMFDTVHRGLSDYGGNYSGRYVGRRLFSDACDKFLRFKKISPQKRRKIYILF